ncbi:ATP-binding cassette domain-containing protein [Paenibacillus thalictri]|uniref:ATP-binding cassette domain-containing protein n=1 Tax=Paenibacillus thalictri TaxID=2527873 RepID=A0A4V2J3H4_9BACL|nr:ATP-binding cassette domain-containing protein [Paenibacillus thalictri]TBL72471.1 ATP-binding cassette domain-containing protein [Paenibacillus thalictri]
MTKDIIVSGLSVNMGSKPVLSSVEHRFAAGEITLVLGRNGSGKSTLLEALSGLRKPAAGQVLYGTEPLWPGRKPDVRVLLQSGTAFQFPEEQFFAATVREEFQYTLRPYRFRADEIEPKAVQALETAGGHADWLIRDPYQFSGGQKRRIASALLAAANPDWLLLDEPTAGLDAEGVKLLCAMLSAQKQRGKGVVVVTHDPELLLSVADRIALIANRTIAWSGTLGDWYAHPEPTCAAGLEMPESCRTARLLQSKGWALAEAETDPRQVALALLAQSPTLAPGGVAVVSGAESPEPGHNRVSLAAVQPEVAELAGKRVSESPEPRPSPAPLAMAQSEPTANSAGPTAKAAPFAQWLSYRDPRALWVSYALISAGLLLQNHWLGWLLGAALTALLLIVSRTALAVWLQPLKGFAFMIALAFVVSGFAYDQGRLGFNWNQAATTFFQLSLLVMAMLLGLALLRLGSPLKLQRALEQMLQPLKRIGFPVEAFALTAALIVRFIPLLHNEWRRFAKLAAVRAKLPVREGTVPLRLLRATAVPFLLSLLRIGERMTAALEAKGVARQETSRTLSFRLKFTISDGYAIAAALILFVILLFMSRIPI